MSFFLCGEVFIFCNMIFYELSRIHDNIRILKLDIRSRLAYTAISVFTTYIHVYAYTFVLCVNQTYIISWYPASNVEAQ